MIANDGVFKSTTITGDMKLNGLGDLQIKDRIITATNILSKTITNNEISENVADKIDISKVKFTYDTSVFEMINYELRVKPDIFLTVDGDGQDAGEITVESLTIEGSAITMGTNPSGYMLIGQGDKFIPKEMNGDITIINSGKTSISTGAIMNDMISGSADIEISKTLLEDIKNLNAVYQKMYALLIQA